MFAVFRTGGKQYKVSENDLVTVEKLPGDVGARLSFSEVLMVGGTGPVRIGAPVLAGAEVTAEVVGQERADKVLVIKKKRRHNYRRKRGHVQDQTVLRITGIRAS